MKRFILLIPEHGKSINSIFISNIFFTLDAQSIIFLWGHPMPKNFLCTPPAYKNDKTNPSFLVADNCDYR